MDNGKTNITPMECEPLVPKDELKKSFLSRVLGCCFAKEVKTVPSLVTLGSHNQFRWSNDS